MHLRKNGRKNCRSLFKGKLAFQKEGLAKLQEHLLEEVRKNPDASLEEISRIAGQYADSYGFSEKQRNVIQTLTERYIKQHQVVHDLRRKYPDDRELFKALFGKEPKGRVKIFEEPMMFYVRIFHPTDFAGASLNKYQRGEKVTFRNIVSSSITTSGIVLENVLIPELKGAVIAEDATLLAKLLTLEIFPSKTLYRHEEQHVIENLAADITRQEMKTTYKLALDDDKRSQERTLKKFFRWCRQFGEGHTKNELLAYLKTGEGSLWILYIMMKPEALGGLYDFFSEVVKKYIDRLSNDFGENIRPVAKRAAWAVFKKEYFQLLRNSIAAYGALKKQGYNHEEVTAMLMYEPLRKWPRVVKRQAEAKKGKGGS
jgi:ribosomal protein S17E